jgi:hypothetical protein
VDYAWHMDRSIPVPETGCWLWLGAEKGNGYGNVRNGQRNMTAHRASYIRAVGPVPEGADVCHKCDTRLCINPDHLFIGSRADNMQDAKQKGRVSRGLKHSLTVRGEKAGRAKLTREQVQAIRRAASTLPIAEIAALTGVTADNVRRIVRRETWKEESQCAA